MNFKHRLPGHRLGDSLGDRLGHNLGDSLGDRHGEGFYCYRWAHRGFPALLRCKDLEEGDHTIIFTTTTAVSIAVTAVSIRVQS